MIIRYCFHILLLTLLIGLVPAQSQVLLHSVNDEEESFSFTNDMITYTQDFNDYRGSLETLPQYFMVSWDEERTDNPFTGVGDFDTSDPESSYGAFAAFTSDSEDFSFGIREREPEDLRDARLFFTFTNNTDQPISEFEVSYDVEAWFIGDRRNRIRLKYDNVLDSDERDTFEEDIFSTDNPSAETQIGKVNGALTENRITVSGVVDITTVDDGTGTMFEPIQPGETAYFRWQFSNTDGDGGSLRSGLAVNNLEITAMIETEDTPESFAFTNDVITYTQDFNEYQGSLPTLPQYFMVTWDEERTDNPFTGVGDFETSDPDVAYGGFAAFTSDNEDFSFGIREREPEDLRDARLFFAFTNETDQPISEFEVSYDVEAWFIGDRRNRIRLKYDNLLDSEDRDTFEEDIFSTDNPSSETEIGKVNGALSENRTTVTGIVDITTVDDGSGTMFEPVQPGETAFFRWQFSNTDGDGGSLRSGLAINNLMITLPELTSTVTETGIPTSVSLKQNYPNPFNPTTIIQYQLPSSEFVQLQVFDMLGRQVATLVNGQQSEGTHTVNFDASGLSSGIYIYRLDAGGQTQVKQMTLIK